ncbi:MAG: hypothetical protein SFV32_04780 [Opitutaceae bacterium]|nr:hypothetical protein [Opitutaceae bacterium]
MKTICLGLLSMLFGSMLLSGQTPDFDAAIQLADSEDELAAEVLGGGNVAAKGTLPWYQESIDRLRAKAYLLRDSGDHIKAQKAARGCAKLLRKVAKRLEGSASKYERAYLYYQLADLEVEILGDEKAAERYYKRALQEDPENPAAQEGLQKLAGEQRRRGEKK